MAPKQDWLEAHVTYGADTCLIWPFYTMPNGYGCGPGQTAHRAMCTLAHGPAPSPQHQAAHSCRVRNCVNPRHLRWATGSENNLDKVADGTDFRGGKHPAAKLTIEQVQTIRANPDGLSQRELARLYGVSQQHVSSLQRGREWSWLASS